MNHNNIRFEDDEYSSEPENQLQSTDRQGKPLKLSNQIFVLALRMMATGPHLRSQSKIIY